MSQTVMDRVRAPMLVALFAIAGLFSSLTAFGIWDPWELQIADRARAIARGVETVNTDYIAGLVALSFHWLGVAEWSGRLPSALGGVAALYVAYALGATFDRRRAGLYAGMITGSTPLFLLNALPMGGHALAFAFQALIVLGGAKALFTELSDRWRSLWLLVALVATAGSVALSGALLGALPALLALSATALLGLQQNTDRTTQTAYSVHVPSAVALCAVTAGILVMVTVAISHDSAEYSLWLGGQAAHRTPPSFDVVLERVFHSMAPFSALLPLALAFPLVPRRDGPSPTRDAPLASIMCALWCAAGYGAQTLFLARYGDHATFLPVVGASVLCAWFLADLEHNRRNLPFAGLVTAMLIGLLIRDFALYPTAPLEGLPAKELEVPEVFNPKTGWAVVLGLFAACTTLAFATKHSEQRPDWRAPYRLLAEQYHRGIGFKLWLAVAGLALLGLLVMGLLAAVAPQSAHLNSLGRRLFISVALVVLALPVAVAGGQALLAAYGRWASYRFALVIVAGAVVGLFVAHVFLPTLSGHLSPREVYETFNTLARPGEPIAAFRIASDAASYYAEGEVQSIQNLTELHRYLDGDGRRWAAMGYKDFAGVDSRYRRTHKRHLYVAHIHNANMVLAATEPVAGHPDRNPLLSTVSYSPPETIAHPVHAVFDESVELLGFTTDPPLEQGSVQLGESLAITWYFRVLKHIPTDYTLFLHIDGQGTRIHGDHEVVNDLYPMPLWVVGDVIADRHVVDIRASAPVGRYELMIGFYKGKKRLPVSKGPADDADRVKAGALHIR